MGTETFQVVARSQDGQIGIWRVGAENHQEAISIVTLETLKTPPFIRPRVVLVGISGGKQ